MVPRMYRSSALWWRERGRGQQQAAGCVCHVQRLHCLSALRMVSDYEVDQRGRRGLITSLGGAAAACCLSSSPASAAKAPPTAAKAAATNEKERARNLGTEKKSSVHFSPAGNACPSALIMISPGFLIAPSQYSSYAEAMSQLGYAVRILDLEDTLLETKTLSEGVVKLVSETKNALQVSIR